MVVRLDAESPRRGNRQQPTAPNLDLTRAILPPLNLRRVIRLVFLIALLAALPLSARVAGVEITSRSDVLAGEPFGDTGMYERIVGRVYFSVVVANFHNRRIIDLGNAVNVADGEVAFSADFIAVRPKDPQKGNGSM